MVNGISAQGMQGMQPMQKPDPAKMFSDLSTKVGADENGISKENLQNYLKQLEDNGNGNSKEAKMITNMIKDFDTLSGGTDKITADSMKTGMESLKPQGGPQGGPPPEMDTSKMFSDLSSKVGADSNGITKENLESYLKKLQENGEGDGKEAELIGKLIEDFDNVSGGTDTITADSLKTAFEKNKPQERFDFQDPSTISSEQRQSPIDIRI